MGRIREVHARMLEAWRHATNLVGPGPVSPHFEDSASALAHLRPEGRWVDLGSGAGFPGLVLADVFEGLSVDLVEPRARRAAFLTAVVAEAGVAGRVRVLRARAEELPAASWDGATARALAAPQVALGLAVPLVRSGGLALLMLGPEDPLPAHPRATLFHVEHYRVDGRSRRSALWTVDATPPSP